MYNSLLEIAISFLQMHNSNAILANVKCAK